MSESPVIRVLRALALPAVTVDHLVSTPVLAWTNLEGYGRLLLAFLNDDPANGIVITIETSEDGVYVDADHTYSIAIGPQSQNSYEITGDVIRKYWRVSALAAGAPCQMRWILKGTLRWR